MISLAPDPLRDNRVYRLERSQGSRLGADTARAMLRSRGGSVDAASVSREHQAAFATVSRTVHTLRSGEHAGARQTDVARLTQRQALGYRAGLKP
jgi:hypothetical protein